MKTHNNNSRNLEKLLDSSQISNIELYNNIEDKKTGASKGGFIGRKNEQDFMLKPGVMNPLDIKEINDRNSVLFEFMSSILMSRFLYGQTATISLSIEKDPKKPNISKIIYLRSKIKEGEILDHYISHEYAVGTKDDLSKIQTNKILIYQDDDKIMWCKKGEEPQEINISENDISKGIPYKLYSILTYPNMVSAKDFNLLKQHGVHIFGYPKNIDNLQGLEKIQASCIFTGDRDNHPGNIIINNNKLNKIDHGRACFFSDNSEEIRKNLAEDLSKCLYRKINFDILKFKNSIDEICKISDEEIEILVKAKSYELSSHNFKLDDNISYSVNNETRKLAKGYRFRTLQNVNEFNPLEFGDIAFQVEGGKLFCQTYNHKKIETKDQPELQNYVQKLQDGNKTESVSAFLNKAIEYLNKNHPNYLPDEQKVRYTNLENNYIKQYKKQKEALKELSHDLSLIIDIKKPEQWMKGDWIYDIKGDDIENWAAKNKIKLSEQENCKQKHQDKNLSITDNEESTFELSYCFSSFQQQQSFNKNIPLKFKNGEVAYFEICSNDEYIIKKSCNISSYNQSYHSSPSSLLNVNNRLKLNNNAYSK